MPTESQINKKPNNYIYLSLLSLLFFLPLSLIALYFSIQVNKLYEKGDYIKANNSSIYAVTLSITSILLTVVFLILLFYYPYLLFSFDNVSFR